MTGFTNVFQLFYTSNRSIIPEVNDTNRNIRGRSAPNELPYHVAHVQRELMLRSGETIDVWRQTLEDHDSDAPDNIREDIENEDNGLALQCELAKLEHYQTKEFLTCLEVEFFVP